MSEFISFGLKKIRKIDEGISKIIRASVLHGLNTCLVIG